MPKREDIKKILILGSGPIVIGQACEFDYSGTQAVKALKGEGYTIILVNPNPATVMTTPGIADRIYMEPLEVSYLEEIIKKERPDAVLPTMGGQTALNLALDLDDQGILKKYDVEIIGASIESIKVAEDRGSFKEIVKQIGENSPESILVKTVSEAEVFIKKTGLPVIIRPSFTLGGKGGSIAKNPNEVEALIEKALFDSPVHEALIEESLIGWKEFEMEVMRDHADNAVVICSIENVDPMGVHTGDSITVAPILTLSDREYQRMRDASLKVLRAVGIECGGSNVQFAINPATGKMVIIEMNPRVSRSSALASKATGFPIALCSARLSVGYTLDEITNDITGKTVSSFEPALDYVAVKVPRFETEKFPAGYVELNTQMKSVGESLAIGRTFNEALNKAIRSCEIGFEGLQELSVDDDQLERILGTRHPLRIFAIYTILKREGKKAIEELYRRTRYDYWFLYNFLKQVELEKKIEGIQKEKGTWDSPEGINLLLETKRFGLSDLYIADMSGTEEKMISDIRLKNKISASYHFVDTCAGEFAAQTPYFYSTYGEIDEGGSIGGNSVIIAASGPNRIGQGLEFDTCCTLASLSYRKKGIKTIMVNSNPETVSTDFNVSDRLYMEPITMESIKEIMQKEGEKNIIVQLGGQTSLNLAEKLKDWGANIVGTSIGNITKAEDRHAFSQMIEALGLKQPGGRMAGSRKEVLAKAGEIGFPVLLRPSFVLGGRSMSIAYTEEELIKYLESGITLSKECPVLVDQFLEDAFEYDLDAISDSENVYIAGIMQHIEAAGIHSGDSACVFPPFKSTPEILYEMESAAVKIARELEIKGFLNIQFAVKEGILYVLEVNPRASRTIPFLSKAAGVNLVDAVVRVWLGENLEKQGLTENGVGSGSCKTGWAIKEAVFPFDRFNDIDPVLGPEMKSTGEVIGIGDSFGEAYAKAQISVGNGLPEDGRVFISVHKKDRTTILPIAQKLINMGFTITATRGTARFLFDNGIFSEIILKTHEGSPNVIDHMQTGRIDLLINTPLGKSSQKGDHSIRIEAIRRNIPYTTTTTAAWAAVQGIEYLRRNELTVRTITDNPGETLFITEDI